MSDTPPENSSFSLRDVLSIAPFRSLWLGQISSQLGLNMLIFILALTVYQVTSSNAAVSALFLFYGVPAVLFGMTAGAVVDRIDRRFVLIACDTLRAVLGLALLPLKGNIAIVYLFVFVHALINQLYVPAEAPTIPHLVPKPLIVTANSLFTFTYYTSMAVGFAVAGPLLRLLGPEWSLLTIVVLFSLAAFNVARIPPQGEGFSAIGRIVRYHFPYIVSRVARDLSSGLRYVVASPILFDALLLLTGTQVILAILGTLGPGFADRVLEIDVRDASVVIVGPTVLGIILGALWVGNFGFHLGGKRLIRTGILSAGIIMIFISVIVRLSHIAALTALFTRPVTIGLSLILFFLLGVANSLLDVPANATLQEHAHGTMRGKVYGMLAAGIGGVGILPVVVGGVLADIIGVGKVIFILGLLILSYGLIRLRYNKIEN